MEYNRSQRLFIKLFKPIIKLSEEIKFPEKTVLVGNRIGKYDPVLVSLLAKDITFLMPDEYFLLGGIKNYKCDLANSSIEKIRKIYVDTLESKKMCLFALDKDYLINDKFLKFIELNNNRIVPFIISGSYKMGDRVRIETGNSFLVDDNRDDLSLKINSEIKKLIK